MEQNPRLSLSLLPETFAVCRLLPGATLPEWATRGSMFSITRTADELSIVCEASQVPAEIRAEGGWRALKLKGPFDFSLVGILAAVLVPLAKAGIGIFALSTFDTDMVLVKADRLDFAVTTLREAGHSVD